MRIFKGDDNQSCIFTAMKKLTFISIANDNFKIKMSCKIKSNQMFYSCNFHSFQFRELVITLNNTYLNIVEILIIEFIKYFDDVK